MRRVTYFLGGSGETARNFRKRLLQHSPDNPAATRARVSEISLCLFLTLMLIAKRCKC